MGGVFKKALSGPFFLKTPPNSGSAFEQRNQDALLFIVQMAIYRRQLWDTTPFLHACAHCPPLIGNSSPSSCRTHGSPSRPSPHPLPLPPRTPRGGITPRRRAEKRLNLRYSSVTPSFLFGSASFLPPCFTGRVVCGRALRPLLLIYRHADCVMRSRRRVPAPRGSSVWFCLFRSTERLICWVAEHSRVSRALPS